MTESVTCMHPKLLEQLENKEISNYRINLFFTGEGTDYWKDFHKNRRLHYRSIAHIFGLLTERGVGDKWFFFEPYVEITWLEHKDRGPETLQLLVGLLEDKGFTPRTDEDRKNKMMSHMTYETAQSKDGLTFCEWFDCNYCEKFFGAMRYASTANIAMAMCTTGLAVEKGKGIHAQYMRSLHSLANQMGMNYRQEGWYATKRGMFCLLIWLFHKVFPKRSVGGYLIACFIYEKIFRQKDVR